MQLSFRILDLAARLLLAFGVGCLLLGAYLSWRTLSFASDALHTTGVVVSWHATRDGDTTRYRPRVRFTTVTGEIVTIHGQLATTAQRFADGTRVPVVYRASKPSEARIALFMDNWLGACIAAATGLVGLAGGWLVRGAMRREFARARP